MLNIAIIGTGIIGLAHIEAMEKTDCCRLCAICDVNEEVVKTLAKEKNVPYFLDYHDIPSSDVKVDAVILNLPHFLHCEATVFFLENGIHVLCEKPMANTVKECDRMIEAAKKSGKKLGIGHVQRFIASNMGVKKIVDEGTLGKLCMISETRTKDYFDPNRPKWFLSKEKAGGGITMNYGAHAFDKIFTILGPQDVEIASCIGNIKNDADIEGHAQILAKLDDGISANITFSGYGNFARSDVYYFQNGVVRLPAGTMTDNMGNTEKLDFSQFPSDPMQFQIEEFCKYVNDEPSITPDGAFGRAVINAIEKVYR